MENQELPEPESPGVATFLGVLIILGIIAVPFSLAGGPAAAIGTVCGVMSLFIWRLLIVYIYEASYWARQSALIAQKQYLLARASLPVPAAAASPIAEPETPPNVKAERLITPGGIAMIVALVGAILLVFYFMNDVLKK